MNDKVIYSRRCKCKPRCEVDVSVWIGDKPFYSDDPHQCGQCKRRFSEVLWRAPSGVYSCDRPDCFTVSCRKTAKALAKDPAVKRWLDKAKIVVV